MPKPPRDPEEEKRLVEQINRQTDSPELQPCDEHDIDKMDYATIRRMVYPKKGRWFRFSEEQIQRIAEKEKQKSEAERNGPKFRLRRRPPTFRETFLLQSDSCHYFSRRQTGSDPAKWG